MEGAGLQDDDNPLCIQPSVAVTDSEDSDDDDSIGHNDMQLPEGASERASEGASEGAPARTATNDIHTSLDLPGDEATTIQVMDPDEEDHLVICPHSFSSSTTAAITHP